MGGVKKALYNGLEAVAIATEQELADVEEEFQADEAGFYFKYEEHLKAALSDDELSMFRPPRVEEHE